MADVVRTRVMLIDIGHWRDAARALDGQAAAGETASPEFGDNPAAGRHLPDPPAQLF